MPSLARTSSALCLANRELAARSRRLIAASRRLLNPAWALSGGSADDDLSGSTRMCFVCDEPMLLGVACEISGPEGSVFAHFVCYSPISRRHPELRADETLRHRNHRWNGQAREPPVRRTHPPTRVGTGYVTSPSVRLRRQIRAGWSPAGCFDGR